MSPNVNMTPHKQNVLSAATTIPIYSGHSTSGCPIFRGEFIAFIMFFFCNTESPLVAISKWLMIKKFFYTTYKVNIHILTLMYLFFIYTKKLSLHGQYNIPKTLNTIQIYLHIFLFYIQKSTMNTKALILNRIFMNNTKKYLLLYFLFFIFVNNLICYNPGHRYSYWIGSCRVDEIKSMKINSFCTIFVHLIISHELQWQKQRLTIRNNY